MHARRWTALLFGTALILAAPAVAGAAPAGVDPGEAQILVSGLQGAFGSTVGPAGAL